MLKGKMCMFEGCMNSAVGVPGNRFASPVELSAD
jgi:hypothetical protein